MSMHSHLANCGHEYRCANEDHRGHYYDCPAGTRVRCDACQQKFEEDVEITGEPWQWWLEKEGES